MKQFEPDRTRQFMQSSLGYARFLKKDFDEAKLNYWLGSNSNSGLNMAVQCLLAGLFEPARQLLDKSRHWASVAIETGEKQGDDFGVGDEALRFQTLAMCNWLATGKHDVDTLNQAVDCADLYLEESPRSALSISLMLPLYVDTGAYDRALLVFANCPKLKPPQRLGNIRSEAQMCYVLCRQKLGLEYAVDEVQTALEGFLRRQVDTMWLSEGHYARAAEWMKIAHWHPGDDPFATVLRCYDYLPERTPPEYPPRA